MRSLPARVSPPGVVSSAFCPGRSRARSGAATSARHSSRPWRIRRNNSAPAGSTAPTVALRDEITPSSGERTCVWRSRSACTLASARCASSLACAVRSAVMNWLICCALNAPLLASSRARAALAAASASAASASATAARTCATSACAMSGAKLASTWPFLTRSPTLTYTSASRRPLASVPTIASCQAAMLPLALMRSGSVIGLGCTVVTVKAGRGAACGAAFFSSAARTASAAAPRAMAAARARPSSLKPRSVDGMSFISVIPPGVGRPATQEIANSLHRRGTEDAEVRRVETAFLCANSASSVPLR